MHSTVVVGHGSHASHSLYFICTLCYSLFRVKNFVQLFFILSLKLYMVYNNIKIMLQKRYWFQHSDMHVLQAVRATSVNTYIGCAHLLSFNNMSTILKYTCVLEKRVTSLENLLWLNTPVKLQLLPPYNSGMHVLLGILSIDT